MTDDKWYEAVWNLVSFIVVLIYDFTTKASIVFPLFTAIGPTLFLPSVVMLQIVLNIVLNDWWAEGNYFLLAGQAFTIF